MSYLKTVRVCAQREPMFMGSISVWLFARETADFVRATTSIGKCEFRAMSEGDLCLRQEPTFELSQDVAQQLMDELWNCGLRPTEGTGGAGSLAAVNRHLEDMRTLVFKTAKKS